MPILNIEYSRKVWYHIITGRGTKQKQNPEKTNQNNSLGGIENESTESILRDLNGNNDHNDGYHVRNQSFSKQRGQERDQQA